MGVDPHRLAELRSLAYHRAIVDRWDDLCAASRAREFIEAATRRAPRPRRA